MSVEVGKRYEFKWPWRRPTWRLVGTVKHICLTRGSAGSDTVLVESDACRGNEEQATCLATGCDLIEVECDGNMLTVQLDRVIQREAREDEADCFEKRISCGDWLLGPDYVPQGLAFHQVETAHLGDQELLGEIVNRIRDGMIEGGGLSIREVVLRPTMFKAFVERFRPGITRIRMDDPDEVEYLGQCVVIRSDEPLAEHGPRAILKCNRGCPDYASVRPPPLQALEDIPYLLA